MALLLAAGRRCRCHARRRCRPATTGRTPRLRWRTRRTARTVASDAASGSGRCTSTSRQNVYSVQIRVRPADVAAHQRRFGAHLGHPYAAGVTRGRWGRTDGLTALDAPERRRIRAACLTVGCADLRVRCVRPHATGRRADRLPVDLNVESSWTSLPAIEPPARRAGWSHHWQPGGPILMAETRSRRSHAGGRRQER
jgi:hypothetical protein